MPSTNQKADWCLRVTRSDLGFLEQLDTFLTSRAIKYVCTMEKPLTNMHVHYCIMDVVKSQLRDHINKIGLVGNKIFSLREWKTDNQLTYLFKGPDGPNVQTDPIVLYNSMEVDSQYRHEKYWKDRQDWQNSVKCAKIKNLEFKERLLERYKKLKIPAYQITVMQCIWELCKIENKLPPGDHLCIQYIEYVQCQTDYLPALKLKERRVMEKMALKPVFPN